MTRECDVLIVGGGPGGLAAACAAKKEGADTVIVLERDKKAGGILNQCIHDGYGLLRYHTALTGPEFADRIFHEAADAGADVLTSRHVSGIARAASNAYHVSAYTREGIETYLAKTIVLATGCRERTRGNISIPGSRPAGVFTAGVVQNLVNVRNVMAGKRVVILGSGDIGLIMARRLTLEGAEVLAVVEIMPEPTGMARNVSQCVYEYGIPLYVKTTVSRIIGKRKLEAVELSDLDEKGTVIPDTARRIDCDTLVLSVGLIPENEVARTVGVKLLPNLAVETDGCLQTSVPGIFSCGNSRSVMDLADYVSEQGELAGRNAVRLIKGERMESWDDSKSSCMKKGFPEEGTVTCTICPNGCQVKWNETAQKYAGNRCPRGEAFALQERTAPKRTVTTTVKTAGRERKLLPVRTAEAIDRNQVRTVMEQLKTVTNGEPCKIGDMVYRMKLDGKEVHIIATASIE